MARKGYPFSKRSDKQMTNLVSGILTGLILAPFAIIESLGSNSSNSSYTPSISDTSSKPISKITAIVLIIIGILLIPVFAPLISLAFDLSDFPFFGFLAFFGLISVPFIVWGGIISLVIESFTYQNKNGSKNLEQGDKTLQQQKDNQYDCLIKSLIKQSSNPTYSSIRTRYYEIVKNNNRIYPEIIKLQKKIALHQKEKGLSNIGKSSYHNDVINTSLKQIKELELNHPECEPFSSYKEPVITIEDVYDHITYPFFRGYIYIETNSVCSEKPININESQLLIDKGMTFFNVSAIPLKKLLGRDIEILFYNSFLMLLTKKDFVFVEYKDISSSYSEIALEVNSSYNTKFLNRTKYDCTPTVQIRNAKECAIIEVGLLELEMYSQKINLIFTKYKEGELIHNQITNNKQNIKRLICEIISNNQRYLLSSR